MEVLRVASGVAPWHRTPATNSARLQARRPTPEVTRCAIVKASRADYGATRGFAPIRCHVETTARQRAPTLLSGAAMLIGALWIYLNEVAAMTIAPALAESHHAPTRHLKKLSASCRQDSSQRALAISV